MEQAVYRIIDANYNRAREALRSIEEFCRFLMNSQALSARAKQLRHELCACVAQFDRGKLLCARDTVNDVGVGLTVENQLSRSDLADTLTANCNRLTEALRVLAEMIAVTNPQTAKTIETLRYSAYTLEKDIVLLSCSHEKYARVRFYVIITSDSTDEIISLAKTCSVSGADCLQLRAKNMPDDALVSAAAEFVKICRDNNVLSVINDRMDIAVASGADGVHLGQDDLPLQYVKKLQQQPMIIGKSTHSLPQLQAAIQEQPTYVGIGPVFNSPTKPNVPVAGLDYLRSAIETLKNTSVLHVAIGGITDQNINSALDAGAKAVAVSSFVTKCSNPADACALLKRKILEHPA